MTDVDICNMALRLIGQTTITNMEEASVEAETCKAYYDHVRDAMLRDYPWNFAAKSIQLGQSSVTIPENDFWEYIYTYPSDCLRIHRIFEQGSFAVPVPNDFEIISSDSVKYICCHLYQAYARYTQEITDPTLFDANFVDAFSSKLAMRIAIPLTNSDDRLKVAMSSFQMAMIEAQRSESVEGMEQVWGSEHQHAGMKYVNARR